MGTTIRVFTVDDDDSLHRLSFARYNRLVNHIRGEAMPEHAGRRVRCAMVVLEVDRRIPLYILHIDYFFLNFDAEGRFDKTEVEREERYIGDFIELPDDRPGSENIIPARHHFAKKRYESEFKWTPTQQVESAISEAIFGENRP